MLSIILLRLQSLKYEYHVFLIMTVLSLAMTFVFGATQSQDYTPVVLVVDQDQSEYSQKMFEELKENKSFRYKEATYEEAVDKVENNKVVAALLIKEDFQENIIDAKEPTIGVLRTKEDVNIIMLNNIVSGLASKMIGNTKIAEITTDYISGEKDINEKNIFNIAYDKALEHWKYKKTIDIEPRNLEDNSGGFDDLIHTTIGFSLFFSMYTIVFGIGEILNDRKYNTWQRMLVSPLSRISILGGNLVVTFFIGLLQVGILFMASRYIFGVNLGSNMLGIMIVLVAFVFTVASLGLFLSGIVKTHSQLAAMTPVILTSTSMLGGCMWPLQIVDNKIILALANITPQKWALQGIEAISIYNKGYSEIVIPVLVLIGMGLVFFTAGVKLVKFE